jgi:hypothetical protein
MNRDTSFKLHLSGIYFWIAGGLIIGVIIGIPTFFCGRGAGEHRRPTEQPAPLRAPTKVGSAAINPLQDPTWSCKQAQAAYQVLVDGVPMDVNVAKDDLGGCNTTW